VFGYFSHIALLRGTSQRDVRVLFFACASPATAAVPVTLQCSITIVLSGLLSLSLSLSFYPLLSLSIASICFSVPITPPLSLAVFVVFILFRCDYVLVHVCV
jgi:hypothetical protein